VCYYVFISSIYVLQFICDYFFFKHELLFIYLFTLFLYVFEVFFSFNYVLLCIYYVFIMCYYVLFIPLNMRVIVYLYLFLLSTVCCYLFILVPLIMCFKYLFI
jgi:hypothetical protein